MDFSWYWYSSSSLLPYPHLSPHLKTLIPVSPHSLFTGHGEIKLLLTREIPPYEFSFNALEGTLVAAGRKKNVINSLTQPLPL